MAVAKTKKWLREALEAADQDINAFDTLDAKIRALAEYILSQPQKS